MGEGEPRRREEIHKTTLIICLCLPSRLRAFVVHPPWPGEEVSVGGDPGVPGAHECRDRVEQHDIQVRIGGVPQE